LTDKLSQ